MPVYNAVAQNTVIPWRVRQRFERWVESSCRTRSPALYRWLHIGEARDRLRPLTFGPSHHFFGYYDKCPWNASSTLLLAHEAAFNDRPPSADDSVKVGVVRLDDGKRFEPLAVSYAWNWQQGSMLQWHPADPERLFVHNDRRDGAFRGVVRDCAGREVQVYERPIYAVSPNGSDAYSVNFARLFTHRPGYGYAGGSDPWADDPHPAQDGIHRIDLGSGRSELIVSLDDLAHRGASDETRSAFNWINHIQVSPTGRELAFFHIWRVGEAGWRARLFACRADGSALRCRLEADFVSHYDWLDDDDILIWARPPGDKGHFWLLDGARDGRRIAGDGVLTEDGHVSFSPDRRWVLDDTYPDRHDMRTLMLYRWSDGRRIDIARLHSPKDRWWGEIRCDLHPRWSRDGRALCIDSVHSGERQMYAVDVGDLVGAIAAANPQRSAVVAGEGGRR